MKRLQCLFTTLSLTLSHLMCIIVAYNYRDMLCGIDHMGNSAPAEIAFLQMIPFSIGIIIFAVLAHFVRNKVK